MKILWQYLRPYKKQLVVGPFFKLCEAMLELLIPTLMAYVIDQGIVQKQPSTILRLGAVMLCITLVGMACASVCQYSASIAAQGFGTKVRNAVFAQIETLSYAQVEAYGTSSLVNRITNDINLMQQGVAMTIRLFTRAPFICIGSIIMALFIDPKLALVFIVALPIFALITALVMAITVPLYKVVQSGTDKIAEILRENLLGVRVIRAFAKRKQEQKRFEDANAEYEKAVVRVGKLSAVMHPISMLLMNLVVVAILFFGAKRVHIGSMTQGEITAFISYATYMLTSLVVVATLTIALTKAVASAQRVAELLNLQPQIVDGFDTPSPVIGAPALSFCNVSFAYHAGGEAAVQGISFELDKGQTVGIIGGTGVGKSTIVNLLSRFYEPTKGKILINGVDYQAFSQDDLHQKIGLVSQKAVLLSGTVADNIRQGKPDATEAEIVQALTLAQAYDFIEAKEDGIHTQVSRGGTNFSGGQQQRLSIARALVRKSEILVFDDSASALDNVTNVALRAALKSLDWDVSILIVSQQVSAVCHCDKILVLEDGAQVGFDTHEKLQRNVPLYQAICASQQREETAE